MQKNNLKLYITMALMSFCLAILIWFMFTAKDKSTIFIKKTIKVKNAQNIKMNSNIKLKYITRAYIYENIKTNIEKTYVQNKNDNITINGNELIINNKEYTYYGMIKSNNMIKVLFYAKQNNHKNGFIKVKIGDVLEASLKLIKIDERNIHFLHLKNQNTYKISLNYINKDDFNKKVKNEL